jgi:hypothetical protein
MPDFAFLDLGPLVDGDMELVLVEQRPAESERNRVSVYFLQSSPGPSSGRRRI